MAAVMAFAGILAALGADLSGAAIAATRLQGVADAAALAAAQELVLPSGRSPAEVASEYAARGGARVVACRCDPSGNDVVVEVATEVILPFLGRSRTVHRAARAVAARPLPVSSRFAPPGGGMGPREGRGEHGAGGTEGRRLSALSDAVGDHG